MIQKGSRYVRLSTTGRIRYLPSPSLHVVSLSAICTNSAISVRHYELLRITVQQTRENLHMSVAYIGKSLLIEIV